MNLQINQIRDFIVENLIMDEEAIAFKDDDSLLENGIIDSQGFMELIAWLEFTFDVSVDFDEMVPENFDSINVIAKFVENKTASSQLN